MDVSHMYHPPYPQRHRVPQELKPDGFRLLGEFGRRLWESQGRLKSVLEPAELACPHGKPVAWALPGSYDDICNLADGLNDEYLIDPSEEPHFTSRPIEGEEEDFWGDGRFDPIDREGPWCCSATDEPPPPAAWRYNLYNLNLLALYRDLGWIEHRWCGRCDRQNELDAKKVVRLRGRSQRHFDSDNP